MNPAFVYQRRLKHSVARLAEIVQLSRPLSDGVQVVTTRPLIVPATVAIADGLGAEAHAVSEETAVEAAVYAGLVAQALTGVTALAQPMPDASGATATVHPALLLVQDVFQDAAVQDDTFIRDGVRWTVRAVANQIIAGKTIAVLSLASVVIT